MKRLRLLRWSGTVLSSRTRPPVQTSSFVCRRCQATAAAQSAPPALTDDPRTPSQPAPRTTYTEEQLLRLPSPPISNARSSAKLAALHARLALPTRLPIETLSRTLVDSSADSSPPFNNKAFSILGSDLLSYYTSEYIIAQYPRLPLAVVFAAMYAYVGPKALAAITREWGVEFAAHPGGEVDPGLLQFKRVPPEEPTLTPKPPREIEEIAVQRTNAQGVPHRVGMSGGSIHWDPLGMQAQSPAETQSEASSGVTLERASTNFVRALVGALHLHCGRPAVKKFYRDHFMSRSLNIASLFQFKHPTRDLSRLCAREGFQSPIARVVSETGRRSRHPVFIVGVFSGNDKLGEGAGASLDEARIRASVAALKGWYLYSPLEFRLPSEMEEPGAKEWAPVLVDSGDIVV